MRKASLGNKHAWGNKKSSPGERRVPLGKQPSVPVRKTHPWGNKQGVPVRKKSPWGRISKVYCAERLPLEEQGGGTPLREQKRFPWRKARYTRDNQYPRKLHPQTGTSGTSFWCLEVEFTVVATRNCIPESNLRFNLFGANRGWPRTNPCDDCESSKQNAKGQK